MKFTKALLTGATGGLGEALTTLLASKNIPLIITGRDEEKLKALQKKWPQSNYVVADLAKDRSPIIEVIRKEKPDLIINNAGFGVYGEADKIPTQKHLDILDVNAKAVLEITLEGIKTLERGIILNVSSIAGEFTNPLLSVYGASKAFVTQLSKALDYECRPRGLRILVSLPGQIATPFASKAAHKTILSSKWETIPVEKMAKRLWWQIETQKGVDIYDFRYKIIYFLSRFLLPNRFTAKQIEQSIRKRLTT